MFDAEVEHKRWCEGLDPNYTMVYTDGSEAVDKQGKHIGYNFVAFQRGKKITQSSKALHSNTYIFDAKTIKILRGLEPTLKDTFGEVTVYLENISAIWGLRSNPATFFQ